jgi:hypothetical protein
MGLDVVAAPDVADGRFAHCTVLSHQPATPVSHPLGLGLQGRVDHGLDLLSSEYWLRPRPAAISHKHAKPCAAKRLRHRVTVWH